MKTGTDKNLEHLKFYLLYRNVGLCCYLFLH